MQSNLTSMPPTFGKTERRHFSEEGYVILRQVLSPEAVEGARGAMETLVDRCADELVAAGRIIDRLENLPFQTRLLQLYKGDMDNAPNSFRPELQLPGLFDVFFSPALLDVVEILLGPEIRLYPNYTARPKLPDHPGSLVLWHQDGGYTETLDENKGKAASLRMVNVWSPLVPARIENGCMQFVPGTHKLGVVPHVPKAHYLEISPEYLQPREAQAVSIELDPGDIVLFHNLLFHRGLPNYTDTIRWSLDWRYQDASQPTLRPHDGYMTRSRNNPAAVVQNAQEWTELEGVAEL